MMLFALVFSVMLLVVVVIIVIIVSTFRTPVAPEVSSTNNFTQSECTTSNNASSQQLSKFIDSDISGLNLTPQMGFVSSIDFVVLGQAGQNQSSRLVAGFKSLVLNGEGFRLEQERLSEFAETSADTLHLCVCDLWST